MEHQSCPLVASNTTLLKSGRYSDLTVRCGGREYLLHRAIVCPRSDFLTISCDGRFKEGATGVIDLPDDDPPTFTRLVEYLYTLTYDDDPEKDSEPFTMASANALVYAIADKYNVADLAVLAEAKFRPILSELAYEALCAVVEIVITTTPPSCKSLRFMVFTECVGRMRTLVKHEAFISLLGEHAEVGLALAVEGYETMRAEYDRVKRQLDDVRKTVVSQCVAEKIAEEKIADLKGELKMARKQIADQEVVSSPFYGGFSGRGRGYRGR